MNISITATEAARNFSELLNNIKYRGDRYTVIRGGKPAASLVPAEQGWSSATMADLRGILAQLPALDQDDDTFAADASTAADMQPAMPEARPWE